MTPYQRNEIWERKVRKFVVRFKAVRRDDGQHVIVRTGSYGRSWKAAMRWIRRTWRDKYSYIGKIINKYPHDNRTRYPRIRFPK